MKLSKTQQAKAIELLTNASGFIDVIRFEEGEEVDGDNMEGQINNFLKEVKESQSTLTETGRTRIIIGKNNCVNDTILHLDRNIPDITKKLQNLFADQNYEAMKKQLERLRMIYNDLDDMVDELNELKKKGK